jgi:DNA uptake protein ComE-like DNA-binding protein
VKPLPLLREHPRSVQIVLAVVVPAVYGALTGYFLGVSESVYLVLSVVGIVGALGAGFDHFGARAGAGRGIIAGSVFGASILVAHEIHGAAALAHLPSPAILLIGVTTVLACAFAALGGRLRERVERKEREEADGDGAPRAEPAATMTPAMAVAGAAPAAPAGTTAPAATAAVQTPPEPAVAPAAAEPAVARDPAPASADGLVSLNAGSFEDYRALGMSVTQAKRVVAYRDELGGYSSVQELDQVPGFPRAFLTDLKQKLTA